MQQSTNRLVLILILILGFGAGYFYSLYFVEPLAIKSSPPSRNIDPDKLLKLIQATDLTILDSEQFKSLGTFGESPVDKGITGKKDIFAPI